MNNQQQSNKVINSRVQSQSEPQHEIIALLISHNFMTSVKSLQESSVARDPARPPADPSPQQLWHIWGHPQMFQVR